jgi:hypothetical protein
MERMVVVMDGNHAGVTIRASPVTIHWRPPSRPAQAFGDAVQQGWTFVLLTLSL